MQFAQSAFGADQIQPGIQQEARCGRNVRSQRSETCKDAYDQKPPRTITAWDAWCRNDAQIYDTANRRAQQNISAVPQNSLALSAVAIKQRTSSNQEGPQICCVCRAGKSSTLLLHVALILRSPAPSMLGSGDNETVLLRYRCHCRNCKTRNLLLVPSMPSSDDRQNQRPNASGGGGCSSPPRESMNWTRTRYSTCNRGRQSMFRVWRRLHAQSQGQTDGMTGLQPSCPPRGTVLRGSQ